MKTVVMLGCQDNSFYNFRKELVLAIKDSGYRVILASPYGEKIDYFTKQGIDFVNIDMNRRGTNPVSDLKIIKQYVSLIKRISPNVVLTFSSKCAIYGGWVCKMFKVPCIVNNSGLIILPNRKRFMRPLIDLMYRIGDNKVDCMMYQNSYEEKILNGILKNKVPYVLLPGSGVNLDEFKYTNYPENDDVIIFNYVARIMEGKGILEYLQCAKKIKQSYGNTEFRIYGSYDDDKYRNIVEEYEKEGYIKYCGIKLDMKPYISDAHACIHPSHSEGMTNVVLEHSAMGRPCIGSDIHGVKEGIEDGKTGFWFEVKNVDSMVVAIEKFLKLSHEEKVEMGRAARKKMEQEFDRSIVTEIYLDKITRIVGSRL